MRSLLFTLCLCFGLNLGHAQLLKIRHDAPIPAKSFLFGFETGGQGGIGQNPDTGERISFHNYRLRPRLAFVPSQNLAIGIQVEYEWTWTHLAPVENYYGYGAFIRYYWGSRQAGDDDFFVRLNYFLELNYNRSSNPAEETQDFSEIPAPLATASFQDMSAVAGLNIRFWKGLIFEMGLGLHYMPTHPSERNWQVGGRLGVDWLFNAN
ncbi:MAG: hypothetical protein AAF927_24940 [Bacteroidota bacterium]